jgi:hypothetical protein
MCIIMIYMYYVIENAYLPGAVRLSKVYVDIEDGLAKIHTTIFEKGNHPNL